MGANSSASCCWCTRRDNQLEHLMSSTPHNESLINKGLLEAWRADTASTTELRRGYARFLRRPSTLGNMPSVARWLVVGLIFGLGLAQAATLVARPWRVAHGVA